MESTVLAEKAVKTIYCPYHLGEISPEKCIKSFSDSIIRDFCLRKKCESPAKPCVTCIKQEVGQPKDDENPGYFFAEKNSEQCPFHNKNGQDANPETEFLKAIGVVGVLKEIEETKEKKEVVKMGKWEREVIEIAVNAISIREKNYRDLDKFAEKLRSEKYDPIRVKMTGTDKYRASISPANSYYNERMAAAARIANIKKIRAIISMGEGRKKIKTDKSVKKAGLPKTVSVPVPTTDTIELLLNLTPDALRDALRSALKKRFAEQIDSVAATCRTLADEAVKMKGEIK